KHILTQRYVSLSRWGRAVVSLQASRADTLADSSLRRLPVTATQEMIRTHPLSSVKDGIAECIEACFQCAQVCSICADACLAEPNVADMRRCIGMNLNCATICHATGTVLTRE